jgi:endonuclease-3
LLAHFGSWEAVAAASEGALLLVLPADWSAEDIDEHHLLVKRVSSASAARRSAIAGPCPARPECETGMAARSAGKQTALVVARSKATKQPRA